MIKFQILKQYFDFDGNKKSVDWFYLIENISGKKVLNSGINRKKNLVQSCKNYIEIL